MPKVIDLPTATSMDNADYLLMEESTGGTKKITRSSLEAPSSSTVTPTSPATVSDNQNFLYKSGRLVQLQYWVTGVSVTVGQWVTIGKIPSGYRPIVSMYVPSIDYGSNPSALINITAAGEIRVWGWSWSSSSYRISVAYMSA